MNNFFEKIFEIVKFKQKYKYEMKMRIKVDVNLKIARSLPRYKIKCQIV
jgi:hypothetical protein